MNQIPILFYGDSPSLASGLGRITRDLALAVSRLPQYRVASLGRTNSITGAGIADSRLPFMQYTFAPTAEDQWGVRVLPDVAENHFRGERGVIFTIWDPSRLTWFGDVRSMGEEYEHLHQFLSGQRTPFERWGYFAVDSAGPGEGGAFPSILAATLRGFDRIIAYSQFGRQILAATVPERSVSIDWMPHGYNGNLFMPRKRTQVAQNVVTIGCVMQNQLRKDYGLWARMMNIVRDKLADDRRGLRLWVHTDSIDRHWDLRTLADAYGLTDILTITTDSPSDEDMSHRYSACDLTVLPSLGEGFGYPIVESLACGVPVIHGAYAAGKEWIPDTALLVTPLTYTLDTRYCMMRPVFDPAAWAERIMDTLMSGPSRQVPSAFMQQAVAHLEWKQLWPRVWERWFVAAAERFNG